MGTSRATAAAKAEVDPDDDIKGVLGPIPNMPDDVIAEVRSTEETVLRVGSTSDVKQLASSISFATGDSKQVVLRAIGAGAVNQMMKACAIARGYVATRGIDLTIRPGFQEVMVPDIVDPKNLVKRTALIAVVRVS